MSPSTLVRKHAKRSYQGQMYRCGPTGPQLLTWKRAASPGYLLCRFAHFSGLWNLGERGPSTLPPLAKAHLPAALPPNPPPLRLARVSKKGTSFGSGPNWVQIPTLPVTCFWAGKPPSLFTVKWESQRPPAQGCYSFAKELTHAGSG